MSTVPSSNPTLLDRLSAVPDTLRWNYHVTKHELAGGPKPVYVGKLPYDRFGDVLAASMVEEAEADILNDATGRSNTYDIDPAAVVADYWQEVPEETQPRIHAFLEGDDLSYTATATWPMETDDIRGLAPTHELRRYTGTVPSADGALFAPPGRYVIEANDIDPDAAADVITARLNALSTVNRCWHDGCTMEPSFVQRTAGFNIERDQPGEEAAGDWQELAAMLSIQSATETVREDVGGDGVRYSIHAQAVPSHEPAGHPPESIRFWTYLDDVKHVPGR